MEKTKLITDPDFLSNRTQVAPVRNRVVASGGNRTVLVSAVLTESIDRYQTERDLRTED